MKPSEQINQRADELLAEAQKDHPMLGHGARFDCLATAILEYLDRQQADLSDRFSRVDPEPSGSPG